jgi:acyl-CoA synthetase (AMP-forming)/AMP-acid ligase II
LLAGEGYLKNPAAAQEAFGGGWFHSGYLNIKDRAKDVIISGGENISSLEVEDLLYRHPAVAAASVVAQPDPKWGETPAAFIELKPGRSGPTSRQSSVAGAPASCPGLTACMLMGDARDCAAQLRASNSPVVSWLG